MAAPVARAGGPRFDLPHTTQPTTAVLSALGIDGIPLELGTDFDDFSDLAWTNACEVTATPDRELRRLLFWTMHDAGFVVLHCEWWHFEFGTRRWAAITSQPARYSRADPL